MFLNRLTSFLETTRFFINKGNAKVIFFKVPSTVLLSNLHVNPVQYVSDAIDHDSKLLSKIYWLIKNIQQDTIYNPIQLIKSNDKYFCHPGSTKVVVSTYLLGIDYVEGFYVWYPEIDPNPFILDYKTAEVKDPFSFIKRFRVGDHFSINYARLTEKTVILDNEETKDNLKNYFSKSNAVFRTALEHFKKTTSNFDVPFITYIDKIQWSKKIDLECRSISDKFYLDNFTFQKVNNRWVLLSRSN